MKIRVATPADIKDLFTVRMSVKENVLVNTALVTDEICGHYLTERGKGWACELGGGIAGFAIADVQEDSIWALFVRPEYEGMGIGKALHDTMLDWYFATGKQKVWLTTAPETRAEQFYRAAGWHETGRKNGEIIFELLAAQWRHIHNTGGI